MPHSLSKMPQAVLPQAVFRGTMGCGIGCDSEVASPNTQRLFLSGPRGQNAELGQGGPELSHASTRIGTLTREASQYIILLLHRSEERDDVKAVHHPSLARTLSDARSVTYLHSSPGYATLATLLPLATPPCWGVCMSWITRACHVKQHQHSCHKPSRLS